MRESSLTLSIGGFPPFSSRGCTQLLEPIETAESHRTVNGELVSTGSPAHHKYKTCIKSSDKLPLALDSLWKGQSVEVGCMQWLWQKSDSLELTLDRKPVEGSVIAIGANREPIAVLGIKDQKIKIVSAGFVGYRPILQMKIIDFGYSTEEWGKGEVSWFLKLEEI